MATAGFPSAPANLGNGRTLSSDHFNPTKQIAFRLRCSAEASAAEGASAASPPSSNESPATTPKRAYSIITSLNVQKALRGIPITEVDHYERLGISRGASYDEVRSAYRKKCEDLMNQSLDEGEVSKEHDLLKESYAILSSEDERRLYDWSLARSEKPDRYVWPFEVDKTPMPTESPPQEPEDVGPTRLVGYFFLTWLVISVIMSIALNR